MPPSGSDIGDPPLRRACLRGEELLAPPVLACIVLTALNDHVLKRTVPGLVTGKLSDFAGLFFFPFLITTFLGQIRYITWAAAATAVTFATLKLTGGAFGPIYLVRDPTDLVALVSPLAAVVYARRRWPCAFSVPPS